MLNILFRKNLIITVTFTLFAILSVWWLILGPFSVKPSTEHLKYIWGSFYQLIALWGGILGFFISKSFGGRKSILGKSVIFFSLGLLFQSFGQSVYSYYNLFAGIQAPYPSVGDIGYFGSVILYALGAIFLSKVSGFRFSLKSLANKTQAIFLPLIMLAASYFFFLLHYEFDWSDKLKIFLDFGYPLGQAFYVSIAILTFILSRKFLGGIMKKPVLLFLAALVVQYVSDFNFLFQANNNTWHVGGYGDCLYMVSYLLMTLSIIKIGYALKDIRES